MPLEDLVQMSGTGDQNQDGNSAQQTAPQPAVTINLPGAGKAAATRPRAPAQPRTPAPGPVARLFPSAGEKVVVRKERENGEHGIVGVYTHRELSTFAVIEEFLQRVVLPKYGPGRYHCTVLDANGNQTRYETFPLESPVAAAPDASDTGLIGLLRDVTLRQQKSAQQAELDALLAQLRGTSTSTPPVSGAPDLRAIEARIEELSRRASGGTTSDMDRRLIEKVIDRLEEIERRDRERSMAPAPMPMPMPTPGPSADDIARAVADTVDRVLARMPQQPIVDPNAAADRAFDRMERMMQLMKPPPELPKPPPDDPVDKLVKQLDFLERMKGGRVESLEKKLDDILNRPPPGAIEELEQMSRVFESVEALGARRLGRGGAQGFGEYVSDIFRTLPQTIREASTLVDKVRQKDAQQIAAVERVAKARQSAAQARAAKPAPKLSQNPAGSATSNGSGGARAAYPREFGPYLTAMQNAGDDESRVKAALSAFQALGKNEPWKAYWVRTVTLMRNRDPQAVEFVDALCANLVNNGWLGIDQRDAIKTAFEMQFAAVCDRLFGTQSAAPAPDQVPVPDDDADSDSAEAEAAK